MSLSPSDQEIFNQLESQFKGDKTFKPNIRENPQNKTATVIVVGILLIVAGIVALIIGVAISLILVGVLGFIIMFVGALFLMNRFIENANREAGFNRR